MHQRKGTGKICIMAFIKKVSCNEKNIFINYLPYIYEPHLTYWKTNVQCYSLCMVFFINNLGV